MDKVAFQFPQIFNHKRRKHCFTAQALKEYTMKRKILTIAACIMPFFIMAAAPQSPNKLRSAISPLTALSNDDTVYLEGESDDEVVSASVTLNAKGEMAEIEVMQDEGRLRLPQSSYSGLSGARQAWLEERGALTTLVLEGNSQGKDWRLALIFHPKQLWRTRLSVEDQWRDVMTFYDRDEEMQTSKPEKRTAFSRGFYNN
jgi:hypothetical protein